MDIDQQTLRTVSQFMIKATGVHLDDSKHYLIASRLRQVAKNFEFPSIPALAAALNRPRLDPAIKDAVTSALTTHETLFNRDKHPFETLGTTILPDLAEKHKKHGLRIWCAAVSTGQEAYSVAMTILKNGGSKAFGSVEIIATDVCKQSIEKAQQGRYNRYELSRGISEEDMSRFFRDTGDDHLEANTTLKAMIKFATLNLVEDWWVPRNIHVILLRNVLIYFDNKTKVEILKKANRVLDPQGFLLIGGSETTANLDIPFSIERLGATQLLRPQTLGYSGKL